MSDETKDDSVDDVRAKMKEALDKKNEAAKSGEAHLDGHQHLHGAKHKGDSRMFRRKSGG